MIARRGRAARGSQVVDEQLMYDRLAAYHEAGHAVVAHVLGCPLLYVTIGAEVDGEPVCDQETPPGRTKRQQDRALAAVYLSGYMAQHRHQEYSGDYHAEEPDNSDLADARAIAERWTQTTAGAASYLATAERRAAQIVGTPEGWHAVDALAAALLTHRTLQGAEAHSIIRKALQRRRRPRPGAGRGE
jgi:hypothetical protein